MASAQESFQFVVGASRRRAEPRSQSSGAAHVAQCHLIGSRWPLKLQHRSGLQQSRAPAKKAKASILLFSTAVRQIMQCGLTGRSTGPIAAGRHLGYKSLAQIPARRNRPVSFNVRHHRIQFQRGPRYGTEEKSKQAHGEPSNKTTSKFGALVEIIEGSGRDG